MRASDNKKKIPLWAKVLIIISALPVFMLPIIIRNVSTIRYEEIRMFIMFYPLYVIASTVLTWINYRQRPELSIILIILMWLSHIAMWNL